MKRILLAVLPLACLTASAAYISPEAALRRALGDSRQRVKGAAAEFRQVPLASAKSVYLFQGPDGFAVMPADDVAPALLGYGTGRVASNPEFDYFMAFLSKRVELAAEHPEWVSDFTRPERDSIAPLCQTKWNQSAPYNNECPSDYGRKCYTGCVATSTAQLLKYFNWPPKAQGTGRYYLHYGDKVNQTETEVDLNSYTLDWGNMLDEYNLEYDYSSGEWTCTDSKVQQTAVAHLMAAVGAGVEMQYGTSGSGAYSHNVGRALINNFGFSKDIEFLPRDFYSLCVWEDMMYENLKNCGPIVYDGSNEGGGHSFICDGYAGDGLFHINWGWGGMSDGNFLLDFLDPEHQGAGGSSAGYSTGSSAVLHARPATEENPGTPVYSMRSTEEGMPFTPMDTPLTPQDEFIVGAFYNYGPNAFPAPWYVAMLYESVYDSASVYDDAYMVNENLDLLYGWDGLGWAAPEGVPQGVYKMYVATSVDYETWTPVLVPISAPQFSIGEIDADGNLTIRESQVTLPQVSEATLPTEINMADEQIRATVQLFNRGVTDMDYTVRAQLVQDGVLKAYGEEKTVNVPVAGNVTFEYESTQLTVVESESEPDPEPNPETVRAAEDGEETVELPAGEYKLALSIKDGTGDNWIPMTAFTDVTVVAKQPTGIDMIQSDKAAVWFDLQGRRVNECNLMPGVYVRMAAEGAEKVVIR